MAIAVQVFGACNIKITSAAADNTTLEQLGYSENGPQFSETPKTLEVFGDQNGGDAGVPIDIQLMAREEIVSFDLTKWDDLVLDRLRARLNTVAAKGAPGTMVSPGTLMSTGAFRLLVISDLYDASTNPLAVRNYISALPIMAMDLNRGTKYSRVRMAFRCLPGASSVIWNRTAV